jgi:hypothetical protein
MPPITDAGNCRVLGIRVKAEGRDEGAVALEQCQVGIEAQRDNGDPRLDLGTLDLCEEL